MTLQRYNPALEQANYRFYEVPKVLQMKGSRELHQELQMKADELERMFAVHKLQAMSSKRTSLVEKQSVELNPNMNIVELGRLNSERGKLYDRYVQIRDAKLRGQWDSVRVLNEEKNKVMSDRLEHIRDVMRFTSAEYFNQQELTMQSRRVRVEKLRSSSMHVSGNRSREKQSIKLQEDYDSTRSLKSNNFTHSRTFSSPSPRSSAPPIPRSSSKGSNIGRRQVAPENMVEHSLPNSVDFKEVNTKQLQGVRSATNRLQFSHIPRSKSIHEQKPTTQKDDIWRSQSTRKSSLSYNELKDVSISNQKSDNTKPFLRKGNGIGPGARSRVVKLKAEIEYDNLSSEEESNQMIDKREDSVSMIKNAGNRHRPTDLYIDNSVSKQESEWSAIPNADDIVILKLSSQVEPELASQVTSVPLTLRTPVKQLQESPVQSPVSWTTRMISPFSSSPKRSDTDASVESPVSWNSKSLTDLETDSPRTRKKWSVNASDHQSNNATKGFKHLLNFGRKTRGTEGMVDNISLVSSEDNDDIKDFRDIANRSSDDLRKSRMGLSQNPYTHEAFNGDVKKEASRSFFSLSSFRSKGSDLKHR